MSKSGQRQSRILKSEYPRARHHLKFDKRTGMQMAVLDEFTGGDHAQLLDTLLLTAATQLAGLTC